MLKPNKFNKAIKDNQTSFDDELELQPNKSHRRTVHMQERTDKHIYKRAHSELQLLNCLNDEKLKENPRTENGSITVSKESANFYKDYFDGIKSFE